MSAAAPSAHEAHVLPAPAVVAPGTAAPDRRLQRRSCRTLRVDGAFLIAAGLVQLVNELRSHYLGTGLHGETFTDSPYTIGFVEAHGLAAMVGVLLHWAARQTERRPFHWFAIATHAFLGAANLIFWNSFVELDFVVAGALATAAHGALIVAHARCLPRHSHTR